MSLPFINGTIPDASDFNALSIKSEMASTSGAGLVGTIGSGSGAVSRTVKSKLNDVVSVKDFGAVGDGVTDDTAAIQAAIAYINTIGGGSLYIPGGVYLISASLDLYSNITIYGAGKKTVFKSSSITFHTIIYHIGTDVSVISNVVIRDISLEAGWNSAQSEYGANGLITATYIDNLKIQNCHLSYSRFMGININNCSNVSILNNTLRYMPRDMIAVWNTPNLVIHGNNLLGNDDDGISISTSTPYPTPTRTNIVITDNVLTDTGPIKSVGAFGVTVTGNKLSRTKGEGIAILNAGGFNLNQSCNNIIANNTITDVIERLYFVDGSAPATNNLRTYIYVDSVNWNPGSIGSIPGQPDGSGVITAPYDYYYTNSGASNGNPVRSSSCNIINGNILKRTLPAVTNYSNWGFGQAYTKTGFTNIAVLDGHLRGQGIAFRIPSESLLITNNIIECGNYGISMQLATGVSVADRLANAVIIRGNLIRDALIAGIAINLASIKHQDIIIDNNYIDCDPFFMSANRGTLGTWLASGFPCAILADNTGSATITGNKIRNCAIAISQTGSSASQIIDKNLIYANPIAAGFSTSNAGVGTIPGIGNGAQWWLQFEDSNPASATYKNSLGANLLNYSAMPSSGNWLSGMVVGLRSGSITGTAGSRYITTGYQRLTTGSGAILNTDWSELRSLTGT